MKAELRTKWIEALRGDKYKQAVGLLRSDDGERHCCLGVLCDLMGREHWHKNDMRLLPVVWLSNAGIDHDFGQELARMNDGSDIRRHTFAELADHIEANVPESSANQQPTE